MTNEQDDSIDLCDDTDSEPVPISSGSLSEPHQSNVYAKTFNRVKAELAATKRINQNLCHALETESKLSAFLREEVTKLEFQTEYKSSVYAHTSSRSNMSSMKEEKKPFLKDRKQNSKKHALFLALDESVVPQEARKHFMQFLREISSST